MRYFLAAFLLVLCPAQGAAFNLASWTSNSQVVMTLDMSFESYMAKENGNRAIVLEAQANGLPAANVFIGSHQPPPAQPPIVPNSKWASNFPGFSIALDIHSFYQLSKPTYTAYTTAFIAGLTTALANSNATYSFKIQTEPRCASPSTAGGTRIFFNILTDLQTYDATTPVLGDVWALFGCTTTCAAGTAAGAGSGLVSTLQSYGLPITNAYYIDQLA